MTESTPIWITRWSLSKGIVAGFLTSNRLTWVDDDGRNRFAIVDNYIIRAGRDYFSTKYAAVTRAKEMKRRKIESLRKQIEKLESLTFSEGLS